MGKYILFYNVFLRFNIISLINIFRIICTAELIPIIFITVPLLDLNSFNALLFK